LGKRLLSINEIYSHIKNGMTVTELTQATKYKHSKNLTLTLRKMDLIMIRWCNGRGRVSKDKFKSFVNPHTHYLFLNEDGLLKWLLDNVNDCKRIQSFLRDRGISDQVILSFLVHKRGLKRAIQYAKQVGKEDLLSEVMVSLKNENAMQTLTNKRR